SAAVSGAVTPGVMIGWATLPGEGKASTVVTNSGVRTRIKVAPALIPKVVRNSECAALCCFRGCCFDKRLQTQRTQAKALLGDRHRQLISHENFTRA
ncbi:MAG: hypothetical protein AAGA95_21505, partial [Pseudomonadota bacterium]